MAMLKCNRFLIQFQVVPIFGIMMSDNGALYNLHYIPYHSLSRFILIIARKWKRSHY